MQAPSNNNNNNSLNPSITLQERSIIIENIKKFLIEHLPADQVTSPQKAHELAVRFENHVAMSTSTKEQYQGMIAEKLRMIKMKSNETSPALSNASNSTNSSNNSNNSNKSNISSMSSNTFNSANTVNNVNTGNSTSSANITSSVNLTPQEISQITTRLQQIRPQIPQIDKLLLLHSKLVNPPLNSLEMVKKLTECRNILVNQIEVSTNGTGRKNFVMNLGQLNLLIEQIQRLFNSLVSKMKESAGVSPVVSTSSTSIKSVNSSNGNISGHKSNISGHVTGNNIIGNITGNITSNITPNTITSTLTSTITNTPSITTTALSASSINSLNSSSSSLSTVKSKNLISKPTNSNIHEKLLTQRLSLPPDISNDLQDNWLKRHILSINSAGRKPIGKLLNLNHLKMRNRLLNHELRALKQVHFQMKFHIQESGLGTLNLLISSQEHRFIFQIRQKYPYEQIIYRIEPIHNNDNKSITNLLFEPKSFPMTITSILRNFYK